MKAFAAIAGVFLGGCAAMSYDFETMVTREICAQLLSLPSYDSNHPLRYAELDRRGATCGSRDEIAAVQKANDERVRETMSTLQPPLPARTDNTPRTTYR